MIRKIVIITSFALFSLTGIFGQHEFSVNAGGGFGTLIYKIDDGDKKGGFGVQFGLGYRYQINRYWGAVSGVGLSMYNAKFNAGSLNTSSSVFDREEEINFDFRSALNAYEESQVAMLLQIPVMGQYLHPLYLPFGDFKCYANGGLKFGIPIGSNYSSNVGSVYNKGYYSEEEIEYDTQTFMGFGTFNNRANNGDLKLKFAVLFALEWGVKFALNRDLSLHAGAFFDIGLNNIHNSVAPKFVEYNTEMPQNFKVNSVIHSSNELFTEKIRPITFGLKAALAFER